MLLLPVEQGRRKAKSEKLRKAKRDDRRGESGRPEAGGKGKKRKQNRRMGSRFGPAYGGDLVKVLTGKKSVMKNVV